MKLSATDQTLYPQLARYLRIELPKLATYPKILKNVKKYGNIDKVEFTNAVTWNSGPLLVVTDLNHGQCGVPQAYGCFDGTKPTQIQIDKVTVNQFEKGVSGQKDNNAKGKAVFVVGATILHELCHWGNHNNVPRIPEVLEMGEQFELNTYGKGIF